MAPLIPIALQLASFAPSLMRFLGAGEAAVGVAETAVKVAQQVTGAATPEEAVQAMKVDPALQLAFRERVLEMDGELERAYLADRQDARARDVALHQAGYRNIRADLMVVGAVVGLVSCLLVLAFFKKEVPGEVVGIVSTIAGIFGACLRDAFQFEFGSSRGSREKDQQLMQAIKG